MAEKNERNKKTDKTLIRIILRLCIRLINKEGLNEGKGN